MQKNVVNKIKTVVVAICSIGLIVGYPFLSYVLQQNNYGAILPIFLAAIICWRGLNAIHSDNRNTLIGIAIVVLMCAIFISTAIIQFIPVIIYLTLVWFFGRTLIAPPSLIERFVRLQFSDIPEDVLIYCRQLTAVWTVLFGSVVLVSVFLMITGQDWYLTLLHGVVVWIVMAVLTVSEYVYRFNRFPFMKEQAPSITETVQLIIKSKDQLW